MKIYLTGADAVSDLHTNGFTNDFQLVGNELWWVQEKLCIKMGEFTILECHKIAERGSSVIVFGIITTDHNIKGILISHYKTHKAIAPSELVQSLLK